MLVKWSVQQDFELVSSVLVQFATRTGRQKGNPKGVDETPHSQIQSLGIGFAPKKWKSSTFLAYRWWQRPTPP